MSQEGRSTNGTGKPTLLDHVLSTIAIAWLVLSVLVGFSVAYAIDWAVDTFVQVRHSRH